MFVKSKNYDKAIQKVRINVGTEVGLEKDDEAFITLKELPTLDMMKLKEVYSKGNEELINFFKTLLPIIIVDHNFYATEQKKMSNEELADFLFERTDLTLKVLNTYSKASFFIPKKKEESK